MGANKSTPAPRPPTPPPSPTFKEPWREISWGKNVGDLQYVKEYHPQNDAVKHLRVLLSGPVGTGRSSFINSVRSVLCGKIMCPALACSINAEDSFTKKYQTHRIPKESRGNFYPFVFNDIMGLEEGTGRGIDIKLFLKGHVKEGHKFSAVSGLSKGDSDYNTSPCPDDKVHVLVWICSANSTNIIDSVLEKMRAIREAASDIGIPQLVLVTKVDEACAETQKDLKNVYKSKHVKKKMTEFSSALGIPLNCILPVKNYSQEIGIDVDMDSLILSALKLIIDLGDDFINTM